MLVPLHCLCGVATPAVDLGLGEQLLLVVVLVLQAELGTLVRPEEGGSAHDGVMPDGEVEPGLGLALGLEETDLLYVADLPP